MISDNSESQIDFLDLKIIKIKIQALLLLRFNLRFETLLFDSPANNLAPLDWIKTYVQTLCSCQMPKRCISKIHLNTRSVLEIN